MIRCISGVLFLLVSLSTSLFASDPNDCYLSHVEIENLSSDPEVLSDQIKACFAKERLFWWMTGSSAPSFDRLFSIVESLETEGFFPAQTAEVKTMIRPGRDGREHRISVIEIDGVRLVKDSDSRAIRIHAGSHYRSIVR